MILYCLEGYTLFPKELEAVSWWLTIIIIITTTITVNVAVVAVLLLLLLLVGVVFLKIDAVNLSYYIGGICTLYYL